MGATDRNPQYYCPLRDRYINMGDADILVVSREAKEDQAKPDDPVAEANIVLRRAYNEEKDEVQEICDYFWDETEFHCFDQVFDAYQCTNILALVEDETAGMISYKKIDDTLYIVILNVYPEYQGQGIARRLINEALEQGRKQGCNTAKVATTNDDIPALCVYQKMGFRFTELLSGKVADHHGDELTGFAGIPVLDEIRLQRSLESATD